MIKFVNEFKKIVMENKALKHFRPWKIWWSKITIC